MLSKWGTYPVFFESATENVHPDDLTGFLKETHNCKVYECTGYDEFYITIKYGDNCYRVKREFFKSTKAPKFQFGQKVALMDRSDQDAAITGIMWHYEKEEHYYFVMIDGKNKSKRYSESELRICPRHI